MKFLLVSSLLFTALFTVRALEECSGATVLDADTLVGYKYEYKRSLVTLSNGKCVTNNITKIDDNTVRIIHRQYVNMDWEVIEWICPLDDKTLHVTDGTNEIATMNVLATNEDFTILEACTVLDLPVAMIVAIKTKEDPSDVILAKINTVLDIQDNTTPYMFRVEQDCEDN